MTHDAEAIASAFVIVSSFSAFGFSIPLFRVILEFLVSRLHFLSRLPIVVIGFIMGQFYRWSQICCHEPEQSEVD